MDKVSKRTPVWLQIDYPDRQLDRVTTFFRPLAAIPILIILASIGGAPFGWETGPWEFNWPGIPGLLVVGPALMVVFRRKYPRWWFDWNLNLSQFSTRVMAYMGLLTDRYPSTEDEQDVDLMLRYPEASEDLNRWLPLVKWLLAIPHYIVLCFMNIAAFMIVILAWFAILFTGRYPKPLFYFVVGVLRWNLRVIAYAFMLITDNYPAFSLEQQATEADSPE